ncbi:hypothetical protein SASPL_148066 [Salvia splendens]|uniref:Leucine-rich repeat-containing N-terminal plant-type domain-containing protein n=2 Tax=Salvia splendens TaxID=180675 RepID=A0A8X8W9K6_SALSN|nr:hypothetical protein SASPL_148066 [Salvia splendens]
MLTSSAPLTDFTTDREALLAFKKAITVDTSGVLSKKWLTNTSICDWTGVSCGIKHHRVTALNLSNIGLHGNLTPHLGNLTFLRSLDISYNYFSGNIPSSIFNISRLELINLLGNKLSGSIPTNLVSLLNLQVLDLSSNNLTG